MLTKEENERLTRVGPGTLMGNPEINEPMIPIARGSTYTAFRAGIPDEDYGGVRRIPVGVSL